MIIYGAFHCHGGTPIAGWFLLGKMDDLGVASFIETPIWDCGGNILGIYWEYTGNMGKLGGSRVIFFVISSG